MEFLVEMTTTVPEGTTEDQVVEMRRREAANSERLIAEGTLLRLWRPPLRAGEWRTFGLFAAADGTALDAALATMPLRIWREDTVTELSPHPNDPSGSAATGAGPEYFVTFTVTAPPASDAEAFAAAEAGETVSAHGHARSGTLQRLWRLPADAETGRALGLWRDDDPAHLQRILDELPLTPWMSTEVLPLSAHPSDPAAILI
ncbi:muconolactone Delta-isomerase family protein [Microbacterium sp. NPDC089698]|uniref:muconolactone Delta-isomerase family protein n=1 Tax=Microbacterium sp. NPDC089698 TaxID=3364200 RepID=UPI0037F2813E